MMRQTAAVVRPLVTLVTYSGRLQVGDKQLVMV
jgi:hypothetical protein